ncbi:MAG: hypothetical protein K8R85_02700 [Bacteroidetes bacterium]|nr:hypothetical protein [Bacteroidota bacterium]
MKFLFPLFLVFAFTACSPKLPLVQHRNSVKIAVGPGPEDIVLDTFSGSYPRILASCLQRRNGKDAYAQICEVNLINDSYKILKRSNEPQGMVFRPHGFDLVKNLKGEVLLYCISHNEEKKEHSIIIYTVFADHLQFKEKLDSPLLVSPNDVTANCAGEIFVTNDARKRGSAMESLLKLKTSNVVSYHPTNQQWNVAANRFSYANGIAINHCPSDYVLLSTIRSNKLYMLKNRIDNKDRYVPKTIAKLKGLDNITFITDNEILVTAHLNQIAFLKHYKDPKNISPTVVYRVNIITGEYKAVYSNDGSDISGGSTALYYNGKVYISQVFEPFLLKCDAEDLK